jgi:hypothetical protein
MKTVTELQAHDGTMAETCGAHNPAFKKVPAVQLAVLLALYSCM